MTPNDTQLSSISAAGAAATGEAMSLLMLKYLRAAIARWEEIRVPTQLERTNQELGVQLAKAREELAALKAQPAPVDLTPEEIERNEFEAWAKSPDGARYDICLNKIGPSGDMYHYIDTRMVFAAWQAARKPNTPTP